MKKMRREVLKGVIIFGICCILLSSGMLAEIVFKQGTDGSGDSWNGPINVITNSNGRVWEATGANIIAAISDLGGYGKVTLPEGLIELSADIDINVPGVELCGAGMNSTILKLTGGSFADDVIGIGYDGIATACHNCTLRDFTLDCNDQTGWSGIGTYGANDLVIDHVRVLNAKYSGIKVSARDVGPPSVGYPNRVMITNCRIINFGTSGSSSHGISGAGCNATMSNIFVDNTDSEGLGLDAANSENCVFSNFIIHDCDGGGIKIDSTQRECTGNVFTGFTITGCGYDADYGPAVGVTGDTNGENCFSDFIIDDCKRGIAAYGGGGNSTFNNFHISNCGTKGAIMCLGNNYRFSNIFVNGHANGLTQSDGVIQIGYSTSTTYGILLDNIHVYNVVDGSESVSGIRFYDAHDCLLTNVYLDGIDDDGIYIGFGSDKITILGGVIKDCGGNGIYVSTTGRNVTINSIQTYDIVDSADIHIGDTADRFIVSNCICEGNIDINAAASGTRICSADNNICASIVTS